MSKSFQWLGWQDIHPRPARRKKPEEQVLRSLFWLGQIRQALTIYKEDIRNRLDKFNPES